MVYTLEVAEHSTGSCGNCELGFDVTASVDLSQSTCDSAMWEGYETMEEPYAVDEIKDGTATWYYYNTGTTLGYGFWDESGANYLADGGCTPRVE